MAVAMLFGRYSYSRWLSAAHAAAGLTRSDVNRVAVKAVAAVVVVALLMYLVFSIMLGPYF